jgi:DNA-directed RNA polymerase specialized sigma24 family protein
MTEQFRGRGRRLWTTEEDAQVIDALRRHNKLQDVASELEDQLDRTWAAIMNRARLLSQDVPEFQQSSTRRRWTAEDDQYLRDHWEKQTPEEIAEHLGRSIGSVKMRVSVLGFAPKRRVRSA